MPHVFFEARGRVPGDFLSFVEEVVSDFYNAVETAPEILEVYVFESTWLKRRFLEDEARELGVLVVGDYPVSHDAWRGWPRIHLDYEKLKNLQPRTVRALLAHECAHAILHGSLSSYLIRVEGWTEEELGEGFIEGLYLASTVVKDLEVSAFLKERGLYDVLADYYSYVREELAGTDCEGLHGLLDFAKLATPCALIDCDPPPCILARGCCAKRCEDIVEVLREVSRLKTGLSERVTFLLRRIKELVGEERVCL
ncbi:hypothetical protein [Thermogladius calderae]|uniref:hypothetical protein n=1 Tax=Thermogladius calderae TaxID=1200300 RepID=UPI00064E86A0|nr:hypothetical protein [Thermogladius calderae]